MNELIYLEWINQGRINDDLIDTDIILFFLKYFDKHSLRLHDFENKTFIFTNDAEFISISTQQIEAYVNDMKSGIPFPWSEYE